MTPDARADSGDERRFRFKHLEMRIVAAMLIAPTSLSSQQKAPDASQSPLSFFLAVQEANTLPAAVDPAHVPTLRKRIALDLDGVSLRIALRTISDLSGLQFVYAGDLVDAGRAVHLKAGDISVAAALTEVLLGSPVAIVLRSDGAAILVPAASVFAQHDTASTVRGTVSDSAGNPIGNAEVYVLTSGRGGRTDEAGRYAVGQLVQGPTRLRVRMPGWQPVDTAITLAPHGIVTLDLAFQHRTAALDTIRSALVYTEDPLFATLTDKHGYFRLGELPSGPITVRAEHGGFEAIEFQLRLPPDSTVGIGLKLVRAETPFGRMQLDSGTDAGAQGRMVRVVSENGQPIMYANVTLEGATTRITDEKGEINLGSGKRQELIVRVARIGFAPWFGKVDLPAVATMTVTLPRIAQTLAPVTVNGEASPKSALALTGFYDRWMMRQRGALSAVFIGPEEIEFRHPTKVTRMLQGLNGVRLICDISGNCAIHSTSQTSLQTGGGCPMAILFDGNQMYGSVNVDQLINVNDVMAIEVYPRRGNMPISLQANDTNCGVVAFWTGSRR
jgi:hypothetical protein